MTGEPIRSTAQSARRARLVPWALATFVWLVPLAAMQLSDEIRWDAADFLLFGVMLVGAASSYELVVRLTSRRAYRLAGGVAIGAVFLLVWAALAVGI